MNWRLECILCCKPCWDSAASSQNHFAKMHSWRHRNYRFCLVLGRAFAWMTNLYSIAYLMVCAESFAAVFGSILGRGRSPFFVGIREVLWCWLVWDRAFGRGIQKRINVFEKPDQAEGHHCKCLHLGTHLSSRCVSYSEMPKMDWTFGLGSRFVKCRTSASATANHSAYQHLHYLCP